jgi:MFS family permease
VRGHQITTGHILDLVAPFQYYLLFWLFVILPQNETDRRRLLVWMLICSALVAVVGLLQAAGIGAIKSLLATWYASSHNEASLGSRVGRITSLMGAWNALGILMMATLIIGWAMLPNVADQTTRYVVWACLGLCGICLLASGSFAGIGLTVAGIMMLEVLEKRFWQSIKRLFPIMLAMGVFFVVLQPLLMPLIEARLAFQYREGGILPQTLVYRFWIWTDVFWPHIVAHPIWGAYLQPPDYFAWTVPESQYISLLFRFGIVGLVAHLLWVSIMLRWLHRRFTASQGLSRAIAASAFSILVMMSLGGLTNAVFYFSGAADFMWILFGLVVNSEETA